MDLGWTERNGSPPNENYRFYTCELTRTHWECRKGFFEKPRRLDSLCSQIIPIESWKPAFLDPVFISFKLQKGVLIRPDATLYTRKSWEGVAEQKEVKSSE
jgi:hypothetical protein